MSVDVAIYTHSISDLERMAKAVASSNLFGVKTTDQALALMFLSQAEGLHPATAARDYHIIDGKPSLKSDAILARFQAAGGTVKWLEYTDKSVKAVFAHPQGGSLEVGWDMERAKQAELGTRTNWKKYPRQMLRARVISEGIRTVYPAVLVGMYTPEEVEDFDKPSQVSTEPEAIVIDVIEPITDKQKSAIAIALKKAGFDGANEEAKAKGRSFVAFLLGVESIESITDLSTKQGMIVLDKIGGLVEGKYKADDAKLEACINDWLAYQASQHSEEKKFEELGSQ